MINLLNPMYWFQIQPAAMVPWASTASIVIFTAMFVVGIGVKVYGAKSGMEKLVRRAVERAGTLLVTMGLIGGVWWLVCYERVPMLSMRVWLLVWLVSMGLWIWSIAKYLRVEVPAKRAKAKEREQYEKWLPKPKK
jgi:protein-S-isoprenylcysteine O-methyltransferase Ste14